MWPDSLASASSPEWAVLASCPHAVPLLACLRPGLGTFCFTAVSHLAPSLCMGRCSHPLTSSRPLYFCSFCALKRTSGDLGLALGLLEPAGLENGWKSDRTCCWPWASCFLGLSSEPPHSSWALFQPPLPIQALEPNSAPSKLTSPAPQDFAPADPPTSQVFGSFEHSEGVQSPLGLWKNLPKVAAPLSHQSCLPSCGLEEPSSSSL